MKLISGPKHTVGHLTIFGWQTCIPWNNREIIKIQFNDLLPEGTKIPILKIGHYTFSDLVVKAVPTTQQQFSLCEVGNYRYGERLY